MRMLKLGREHDLASEALTVHSGAKLGLEHLHDDGAPERVLERHEDATHSAASQLALDAVPGGESGLQLVAESVSQRPSGIKCGTNTDRGCSRESDRRDTAEQRLKIEV
jgi:hypothetical protein